MIKRFKVSLKESVRATNASGNAVVFTEGTAMLVLVIPKYTLWFSEKGNVGILQKEYYMGFRNGYDVDLNKSDFVINN